MSLGLVAYGSSGESDAEDEVCESSSKVVCKKLKDTPLQNSDNEQFILNNKQDCKVTLSNTNADSDASVCGTVLNSLSGEISDDDSGDDNLSRSDMNEIKNAEDKTFLALPAPKVNKLHDIDFDWSRLSSKKPNVPVKISVPSLSELDSEEALEPAKKKVKPSKVGSGLFALLPSPKNHFNNLNKSTLKPLQIGNKTKTSLHNSTNKSIPKVNNLQTKKNVSLTVDYDSPDEDEVCESQKVDFFSLSSPVDVPACEIQIPDDSYDIKSTTSELQVSIQGSKERRGNKFIPDDDLMPSSSSSSLIAQSSSTGSDASYGNSCESFIPLQSEDIELDETALQQLCGRRERHATGGLGVQLIDVKGEAILPDAREWLTKQLTEEQNMSVHSHKKKDGPTTQQRRKHQITYLAFQAKEHELELKNQWANNRMSRKQTQAKYGF